MRSTVPLINVRRLFIPLPWWLMVWFFIPYLLFMTVRLVVWLLPVLARNWRSVALAVGVLWLWHRHGWLVLVLAVITTAGAVSLWWWQWRPSCERLVVLPVVAWWRRLFVYRRHWRETLILCRLAARFDGRLIVPTLLRVHCTHSSDEVLVRMPRGQHPDDWHRAAADLAYAFNTRQCRVYSGTRGTPPTRSGRFAALLRAVDRVRYRDRPRLVRLVFIRRDPLRRIVPALPVPDVADFTALPLGLREDLEPFRLRLLGTHVLIVGATQSGKGSVQWSLIRAIAPAIRTGLVRLWGIDPKGGVELSIGRALFTRYEYADPAPMVVMLEDLVTVMRQRQARMQGEVRTHTPTLDEPLYVLIVDEMLALVALLLDTDLRTRARAALAMLLTQGAGLGVLVVGATQDPRKEVVELRDFFPTRIALRVNEPGHVDLVLGDGSRKRGALADQIPAHPSMRGIGYVVLDERPEPARVRFGYHTDTDVRAMAATYAAPANTPVSTPPTTPTASPTTTPAAAATETPTTPRPGAHRYSPGPLLPDSLANLLNSDTPRDNGRDAV